MAESPTLTELNMSALGDCAVFTTDSAQLQLRQLWSSQTAIFVFLRHFACIACRAHAKQVWNEREKYEKTGGKLIFIGNGQPHFIEKFSEDLALKGALIVTDPTQSAFKAAGFREGFFYVVNPASVVNAVQLVAQGHRQTSYSPDAGKHWQLGGILVVSRNGKPLYHYISESLGDFPEERGLRFIQKNERID